METGFENKKTWYDKSHKILLIIPIILLLSSLIYIIIFSQANGGLFKKDISLTGGTTVTIYSQIDVDQLKKDLSRQLADLNIREIYDIISKKQTAVVVETTTDGETTKQILEQYLGFQLIEGQNSDFEFTGSTLSQGFYNQLMIAIAVAFVLMAIVIFILFRNFVPSMTVILCAFADIIMTLALVDIFGIKMSIGGIVALLMLIGYSVDTDILLTTRAIKRGEGTINKRISSSFKTGITMTLTAICTVGVSLLIVKPFSSVLTQIFKILFIGLLFDILNTWVTNASIIKIYLEKKEKKHEEKVNI